MITRLQAADDHEKTKHEVFRVEVYEKQSEQLHIHKRRRNAFGRPDLAEAYRKAKDLIIEHKVFRLCQFVEIDGINQLTICNLWRIEKMPDGSIKTLEFRLNQGQWEEVTSLKNWPEMPFYPIKNTRSLDWWRSIAKGAIWKALVAAGYHDLPRLILITKWSEDHGDHYKPEMTPNRMAHLLIRRYIGSQGKWNEKKNTHDWKAGFLTQDSMMAGARALRAAFYQHILDADVLSAALTIDYRKVSFREYLGYAQHREGLLKVSAEHRNLLPILPGINRNQWVRDDLFSRKLWVKDGRKTTAIHRQAFRVKSTGRVNNHYKSFDAPAAWRWLSKASSVIIKVWANDDGFGNRSGNRSPTTITNLALANVSVRAPVIAYVHIMRSSGSGRLERYGVSPLIQQLLRLFLIHCARLWKDKGFNEIKLWLRGNGNANISVMLDYLDAEGFEHGQPDKNATWVSLVRRSHDWHRRIAIESMERELDGQALLEWVPLVSVTVIDEIVFTPLSNSRELAVEGYEMHHCIGQYAERCHRGKYRAYSVKEADSSRSTLGFEFIGKEVLWQHMSRCNGPVSPAADKAGKKLIALYQQALESQGNRKSGGS